MTPILSNLLRGLAIGFASAGSVYAQGGNPTDWATPLSTGILAGLGVFAAGLQQRYAPVPIPATAPAPAPAPATSLEGSFPGDTRLDTVPYQPYARDPRQSQGDTR